MRLTTSTFIAPVLFGAFANSAHALDLVEADPPGIISDSQLTIGSRTIKLPFGTWNYIAKRKTNVINTVNNQVLGSTYRIYAVDVQDDVFRNGVELYLTKASVNTAGWVNVPCKAEGFLFKDDFNSSFKLPECLLVIKRASHLNRSTGDFYPQASQWIADKKLKLPGAVYEVVYSKYASNDFGVIRLWIPVKDVSGDDAIVAWAQGLPDRFKRLFENRDAEGSLPIIPSNR